MSTISSLSIHQKSPQRARRRLAERFAFGVITFACASVIAPILLLFWYLISSGAKRISWGFLNEFPNAVDMTGGIFPAIVGTILLMIATVAIALPLGVVSAIYLVEYGGKSRWVSIIRQAIVNLAGVPSIVHGLFGLGFFVFFVGGTIDRL
ncbi:MAG: hypothetical protein ABL962_12525, partial [Fimbriimonadaceae bacterium]